MTTTKILITAAVLLLAAPIVPALAHDHADNDYARHDEFHDQLSAAHQRAHEERFFSSAEHRAYHRALRDLHDGYHDDEDGTSYRSYVPYRSYYYGRPRFSVFWRW